MKTDEISNNQDVIDSRDIIERIEELKSEQTDFQDSLEEAKEELESLDEDATDDEKFEKKEAVKNAEEALKEFDNDYGEELKALKSIADECEGYGDWESGETLIRESYFSEYAEELCKDIGDMPKELPWYIADHIDWDGVADELKADYNEVDFDGVAYFIRA